MSSEEFLLMVSLPTELALRSALRDLHENKAEVIEKASNSKNIEIFGKTSFFLHFDREEDAKQAEKFLKENFKEINDTRII